MSVEHTRPRPLLFPAAAAAETLARLRPGSLERAWRATQLAARAGDAPRTGRSARRGLGILAGSPDRLAAVLEAGAARRRRPRVLDPDRALAALGDLQARLAPHGLRPFLMFGSLLGAVREGAFIPGDWDLDLGLLGAEGLVAARTALAAEGFPVPALRLIGGRPSKLTISHPNGAELEIKAFEPEPDGHTGWDTNARNLVLRKRFPRHFGLRSMSFQGLDVSLPDCAEAFLEWQYGPGWRSPDPGYHALTSGPLHGPEHRAFIHAVGPRVLLGRIRRGDTRKSLAAARNLAGLFPEEALFARLAAALEAPAALSSPTGSRVGQDRGAPGCGR